MIDSSTLINLAHLGLATKLSPFFDVVYVPSGVQKEVNRKSRFRYHLKKLYRSGLFARCTAVDETNVNLLKPQLGQGEAEALIQAQEKNARFFIGDDRQARMIGERMGFTAVGTARLVARLYLEGQAEEPWKTIRKLRKDLGYRIADAVAKAAIDQAAEPI